MHIPVVGRKEYTLVDISPDDFTTLMDEEGNCREDIKLPDIPEGFARQIRQFFESGKKLKKIILVTNAVKKTSNLIEYFTF